MISAEQFKHPNNRLKPIAVRDPIRPYRVSRRACPCHITRLQLPPSPPSGLPYWTIISYKIYTCKRAHDGGHVFRLTRYSTAAKSWPVGVWGKAYKSKTSDLVQGDSVGHRWSHWGQDEIYSIAVCQLWEIVVSWMVFVVFWASLCWCIWTYGHLAGKGNPV
jgi:hypothetical protein